MEDGVDAAHALVDRRAIANIADDELGVGREMRRTSRVRAMNLRLQVIERNDRMSLGQEPIDDV
jgi:hypothetical protein